MIKNNRFTDDTQGERIERLTLLSANIGVYGPLIGLPAPKIALAATAFDDYVGAVATAGVEDGQMDEAYETYNLAVKDCARFYALVRAHLQEIIWDYDKPDDFLHAYGFEGDSPSWYSGLVPKIEQWEENHALLVTALDPRVIPDLVLADLSGKRDNMVSLQAIAFAEGRESSQAYDALHELFELHTKLLRFILTGSHLVWGVEDPRLVELGFQTASGVWTPGEPVPGERTFSEPFENFEAKLQMEPSPMNVVGWTQYSDCDFARLYRAKAPINDPIPERPDQIWQDKITENPIADTEVKPGYVYYYWVCAVKDGVEGEFVMAMAKYPAV